MVKKTKSISINILSALIILICLSLSCVGVTNSWFTSEVNNGVLISINVGKLQLNLYQDINGTNTKILTKEENSTSQTPQFVVLKQAIMPDQENELILSLANDDPGSSSMYVRFKFEVYVRGVNTDSFIETTIGGYKQQTSTGNGFVLDQTSGYYYYKDSNSANAMLAKGESATIMGSFTVPYSSFINNDGSLKLVNSDTIYINLIIEASSNSSFGDI